MEITRFQVTNIGRFSRIEVPLAPTEKCVSNITVLLGSNGAGKTSLLNALATSLSWLVARIRSEKGSGCQIHTGTIKNGAAWGGIDIEVVDHGGRQYDPCADESEALFHWSLVKAQTGKKATESTSLSDTTRLANHYRQHLTDQESTASLPLVALYPVERTVLDIPLKLRNRHSFNQLDGYDNALSQGVDFRRFFEWFREREDAENESSLPADLLDNLVKSLGPADTPVWETLKKIQASSRDRQLTAVRAAIAAFMPGFSNLHVRRKPRLAMVIEKEGKILNVAQLSQGEKSLMALVGDIARRLAMMNPALENPLDGDGIVLIDEVDLHLHPKWQLTLLQRLSGTFKNCQFVVTTHSPLVVSGAPGILSYSIDDGQLIKLDTLYGLDANHTLVQGMDSAYRDEAIQNQLDEFIDTLQDGDTNRAKAMLNNLKQILPPGHIELSKAELLMLKLDASREENR